MTRSVVLGKFFVGGRPKRAVRGFGSKFVLKAEISQPQAHPEHVCMVGWGMFTAVTSVTSVASALSFRACLK